MAQKREKEETELKVPETLTLCTPPITTASSNQSPDRSDLDLAKVNDVIVDFRPNRSENINPSRKRRSDALELVDEPLVDEPVAEPEPVEKMTCTGFKKRVVNRCSGCKKKVGLFGFTCRCGDMFCSEHRYSDRHDCSYDYKSAGREAIARENPVVKAAKIVKV